MVGRLELKPCGNVTRDLAPRQRGGEEDSGTQSESLRGCERRGQITFTSRQAYFQDLSMLLQGVEDKRQGSSNVNRGQTGDEETLCQLRCYGARSHSAL